jgi:hypothetical protein
MDQATRSLVRCDATQLLIKRMTTDAGVVVCRNLTADRSRKKSEQANRADRRMAAGKTC